MEIPALTLASTAPENKELLSRGLIDLDVQVKQKDIEMAAVTLDMGISTIKQYLKGEVKSIPTGKTLHDFLRNLVIKREQAA